MRNAKAILLALFLLTSILPIFAAISLAQIKITPLQGPPTGDTTTVYLLDTVGGTTNPPNGTNIITDSTITLTATPDTGFEFAYWVYDGPYPGTADADHSGATVFYENPIDISCAAGTTVYWEAVFVPSGSMSVQTQGIGLAYVVVAVVAVAAVVGVGAFLVGKRGKASP